MELIYLRAYGSGYRGCAITRDRYLFFQCSRKKGLKILKTYSHEEFADLDHFMAMMQKFISPPSFLRPPITIAGLTMQELDRVHRELSEKNEP
jgi:hypothetical protein